MDTNHFRAVVIRYAESLKQLHKFVILAGILRDINTMAFGHVDIL